MPYTEKVQSGGVNAFTRPADTTAYAAGDRIGATTSDSDVTPLRTLFTARRNGGYGIITKLILMTDLVTFVNQIRIHFYTVSAPTGSVGGDNAIMGVEYENRNQYLGYLNFAALAEPIVVAKSDVALAMLLEQKFGFQCASGDNKIYYALQTIDISVAPASAQKFHLMVETEES